MTEMLKIFSLHSEGPNVFVQSNEGKTTSELAASLTSTRKEEKTECASSYDRAQYRILEKLKHSIPSLERLPDPKDIIPIAEPFNQSTTLKCCFGGCPRYANVKFTYKEEEHGLCHQHQKVINKVSHTRGDMRHYFPEQRVIPPEERTPHKPFGAAKDDDS